MDYIDCFSPHNKGQTTFTVFRNDSSIGTFLGEKQIQNKQISILFSNHPKILVDDILLDTKTQARYKVVDIITKSTKYPFKNGIEVLVENLSTTQPQCNITANSSVVAVNSTISAPITISSLQQQIENCLPEDRELALELMSTLKALEQSKHSIKKNALQKFGDFLKKYSPIAITVGQILVQILSQH